jgi:DNA-binding beta-propeller fold protein YncE
MKAAPSANHYEYVFTDGSSAVNLYVYDMDDNFNLVKSVAIPTNGQNGVRGVDVDPASGSLYVSHGGDGCPRLRQLSCWFGPNGNGSLLKYNLLTNQVIYDHQYSHGIDSFSLSADGSKVFMPEGELSGGNLWYVEDASTGNDIASIPGGAGPHNTATSISGAHVYMAGRTNSNQYLYAADTMTYAQYRKIGPLLGGVRPFTINATETFAFTTASNFLGFQISNIGSSGSVSYTINVLQLIPGWVSNSPASTPSHGISLSPDEKEIYLVDSATNNGSQHVHVFDVSGIASNIAPKLLASIAITMSGNESPCSYDCLKDGWIQHSLDGRFVFVGDSGAVISTATRTVVGNISTLANTRKHLEVDWQNGMVVATSTRSGLGRVTGTSTAPAPAPAPL